ELGRQLEEQPGDLCAWDEWLERLERRAGELPRLVRALANAIREVPDELAVWVKRLTGLITARREELRGLAPWVKVLRQGLPPGAPETFQLRWQELRDRLAAPTSAAEVHAEKDSWLAEIKALEELQPGEA